MSQQRPLVRSALLLMAAGAVSRVLGTVYRILIVRWAGTEALGLFQMVIPVFRMASTLATLRLPTALTRLTADRLARGDRQGVLQARTITSVSIILFCFLTTLALFWAAPGIARRLFTDARTELLIVYLPLAVVASGLTGIFRGFAEGRQWMAGTAAGQVVEPVVRLVTVLYLVRLWAGEGVEYAALALVLGLGVGEVAGLATAAALSGWRAFSGSAKTQGVPPRSWWRTANELYTVAFPLWLTTMINTLAQMVNVGLIPRRLMVAGFPVRAATELYGQLTGMVVPLLYLPMILVFPVSTVLTPAMAAGLAAGRYGAARRQFLQAVGGAVAVGFATSILFLTLAEPLVRLLYGAPEIAPLVHVAAVAPPFVYTANIFASVLYALGKTNVLLATFLFATAVRLGLVYHLTADPALGIAGALWALNADYILTALLNGWVAWRLVRGGG